MSAQKPDKQVTVALARGADPVTEKGVINIGRRSINVPDKEAQTRGFKLSASDAKLLTGTYPDRYKNKLTGDGPQHPLGDEEGQQGAEEGQQ